MHTQLGCVFGELTPLTEPERDSVEIQQVGVGTTATQTEGRSRAHPTELGY